ncbi:hypothetical protein [Amycolatopsis thailandensis]|uniref:hypothetical protein n=1 Tax=Amycolatopsis thailandensis TaxID=589330 RepID=UPI0036379AD9
MTGVQRAHGVQEQLGFAVLISQASSLARDPVSKSNPVPSPLGHLSLVQLKAKQDAFEENPSNQVVTLDDGGDELNRGSRALCDLALGEATFIDQCKQVFAELLAIGSLEFF